MELVGDTREGPYAGKGELIVQLKIPNAHLISRGFQKDILDYFQPLVDLTGFGRGQKGGDTAVIELEKKSCGLHKYDIIFSCFAEIDAESAETNDDQG